MNFFSWLYLCITSLVYYVSVVKAGGHGGHHHVVFKIPVIEHTHKHTHTIYKTIHHGHGGGGGGGEHHSHGGKPFHWH